MADDLLEDGEKKLLKPLADSARAVDETRPAGEWCVNVAHYQGYMYAEWSVANTPNHLTFRRMRSSEGTRAAENHVMPAIDRTVAVLLQQLSTVPKLIPPVKQTLAEGNAIETTDALTQHLADKSQLDDRGNWEPFLRWLLLTGIAVDFEYWDKRAGRPFRTMAGEMYKEGKHAREILLPFDVYPDLRVLDPAKAKRFTFRRFSNVDEIRKLYGKKVPPDPEMSDQAAFTWQMRHLGDVPPSLPPSEKAKYVFITLERPSDEYPDGRELHYTLAKHQPEAMLYNDVNHNPNGELQVAIAQYRPMGLGWSTNLSSQLRKNNLSTNGLVSAYIGVVRAATRQIWVAPESSGVSEQTLTDIQRGLISVISYKDDQSPNPPLLMQHPGLPGGALEMLSVLREGREDLSHQHAVMKGQTTGQLRSRPAVQEVRETDLLPVQPLIERLKDNVCEVAGWRAALARRYFSERRTAEVMVGPNRWKAYDFHRSNLSPRTRFYLPVEPNMPLSLEGKLDVLAKAQAVGYPQEKVNAMFSQVFQGSRIGAIASLELRHREAQRWEIERMLRGEAVGVQSWDDDAYHQEEIDNFRNDDPAAYHDLADVVKAQMQDHWQAHDQQAMEKAMDMAERERALAELGGMADEETGGEGEAAPQQGREAVPVGAAAGGG